MCVCTHPCTGEADGENELPSFLVKARLKRHHTGPLSETQIKQ